MIEIKSLHKEFDDIVVFNDFNLSIDDNAMIAIVGSSGSGKSTLLNVIGSLESFESGHVEVDGINLKRISRRKQQSFLRETVSFLFQSYALMEDETVETNILVGTKPQKKALVDVDAVLGAVGLSLYRDRKVQSLSGGEQQRVALARIMIKPAKVVLADEPTGNLDDENARVVWRILSQLNKQGKTVIVVTHDRRFLGEFDRVIEI